MMQLEISRALLCWIILQASRLLVVLPSNGIPSRRGWNLPRRSIRFQIHSWMPLYCRCSAAQRNRFYEWLIASLVVAASEPQTGHGRANVVEQNPICHWFPSLFVQRNEPRWNQSWRKTDRPTSGALLLRVSIGNPSRNELGAFGLDWSTVCCREWHEKDNLIDRDEDDSVEYAMKNTFYFDADKSEGLTGEEELMLPHVFILAMVMTVLRDKPSAMPVISKWAPTRFQVAPDQMSGLLIIGRSFQDKAVNSIFKNPDNVFVKVKAMDLMFRGLMVDCTVADFAGGAVCGMLKDNPEGLIVYDAEHFGFALLGAVSLTRFPLGRVSSDWSEPFARSHAEKRHCGETADESVAWAQKPHGHRPSDRVRWQEQHIQVGWRGVRHLPRHRQLRFPSIPVRERGCGLVCPGYLPQLGRILSEENQTGGQVSHCERDYRARSI